MATRRKPFCSKRLMISPTRPRCTPSGLMAMKVRSVLAMVLRARRVSAGQAARGPRSRPGRHVSTPGTRPASPTRPVPPGSPLYRDPQPPNPAGRTARREDRAGADGGDRRSPGTGGWRSRGVAGCSGRRGPKAGGARSVPRRLTEELGGAAQRLQRVLRPGRKESGCDHPSRTRPRRRGERRPLPAGLPAQPARPRRRK